MSNLECVEFIDFSSATEFLNYLRPTNPDWGEHLDSPWVFRGHANADWTLTPSTWRPLGKDKLKPLADSVFRFFETYDIDLFIRNQSSLWRKTDEDEQRTIFELWQSPSSKDSIIENLAYYVAEQEAVIQFCQLSDELGQPISSQDFTVERFERRIQSMLNSWPDFTPTASYVLAQHHGVPTRLLDWTRNALIASFFAVDAMDSIQKQAPDKIAIWAFDLSYISKIDSRPPTVHSYAQYQHSFLHAQRAVSSAIPLGNVIYLTTGQWPTLEDYIDRVFQNGQQCPLRKITLPTSETDNLLRLLWLEGISRAHLMPTYDNVTQSLLVKWRIE